MGCRVAYRSSLTHDKPILGNVLHLLLVLSQLNLFQMLILGHLKLILLLSIWRECVTIVSTAHRRIDQGILAGGRSLIKRVKLGIDHLITL